MIVFDASLCANIIFDVAQRLYSFQQNINCLDSLVPKRQILKSVSTNFLK